MNKKKQIFFVIASIILTYMMVNYLRPQTFAKSEISREIEDFSTIEASGYQIDGKEFRCLTDDTLMYLDVPYEDEIRLQFDSQSIEYDGLSVQLFYPVDNEYSIEHSITMMATKENNVLHVRENKFAGSKVRIDIGQAENESFTLQNIQLIQHFFSMQIKDIIFLLVMFIIILCVSLSISKIEIWKIILRMWYTLDKLPEGVNKIEQNWIISKAIENYRFAVAFASQILILIVYLIFGRIRYIVNDDTTMVAIAGGGYGEPSQYVINLHIWLGNLLKILFKHFHGINWITVLYLFTYVFSFFVLDIVFFHKKQSFKKHWICLIIINICFFILISHFTFTVVAYSAFISGSISIIYALINKNISINRYLVFGSIALFLGLLIRSEALKSILIIITVFGLAKFIKKHKIRYLSFVLICFVLLNAAAAINMEAYKTNPVQNNFIEWGELRSKALDCKIVEFNEEKFNEKGISKAQYDAIYNAFYYVRDAVSNKNMESLVQLNSLSNKYNFDVIGFLINIFSVSQLYKLLFYIILFGCMVLGSKITKWYSGGIFLGTVMVEAVFYFINRSLYRVVMPNYIFAILLLLLCFCQNEKSTAWFKENKISLFLIEYKLLLIIFIVGSVLNYRMDSSSDYSKERQEVLSYMEVNNDTLFLAGDPNVFNVGTSRSIWNYAGENAKWNLIGNWETYSIVYDSLLSYYNIESKDNIIKDAINNDNILILTSQGSSFTRNGEYILDLIQEYYGFRPEFELVDIICKSQITNNNFEIWNTYKLVYRE